MNDTARRQGRRLTELLTQQRDAYRRLGDLAQTQRAAIDGDRPEELLRILGDRQRMITELTEINERLEPFRSRWNELRNSLPAGERLVVGDLVGEVQKLLVGILDQDQGDCDTLKERSEQFRQSAASTTTGRKLNAAYAAYAGGAYGAGQAKYVDRTDQEG